MFSLKCRSARTESSLKRAARTRLQVFADVASGQVRHDQRSPLSTQLKQIAQTTVTAHAGAEANPPSVNQLTRSTIQTSPVNNSLDRLLETLPGVVQFSYNEPVINGFHGVTYNIDGAPLPLATTSNFAEIIDPKVINSIEVLTGAIPAEYGGDRMGGVVNIISNRPSDIPEGTYGTITGGVRKPVPGPGNVRCRVAVRRERVLLERKRRDDRPRLGCAHVSLRSTTPARATTSSFASSRSWRPATRWRSTTRTSFRSSRFRSTPIPTTRSIRS